MTLYLIGMGLADEKDITMKGLEAIRKCDKIYLENYTSLLQCTVKDLEQFYGKKIILADRDISEQGGEKIVEEAKKKSIAFLVIGDPFSATTHIELFRLAKIKKIPIEVIHNASILTAIGTTGLQLYKFGKTTSIPFPEKVPNLETPYYNIKENHERGLHTLLLLDIEAQEHKFMAVNQAMDILQKIENRKKENVFNDDTLVVACARLGSENQQIQAGPVGELKRRDFGPAPHCLIVPGKLHFIEEAMLQLWR